MSEKADLPPRPGAPVPSPDTFGLYAGEPPVQGPPPPPTYATYVVDPGPARPSLRERVLSLRAVAAVALASVILGAGGGVALGAVTDGSTTSGGPGGQQFGQGQQGQQFGQGQQGQQGQQAPGGTTGDPGDSGDSDDPDDSDDSGGTTDDDGAGTTGGLLDGVPGDPFAGQGAPPAPPGGLPGSTAPRDDSDTGSAAPGTTTGTT